MLAQNVPIQRRRPHDHQTHCTGASLDPTTILRDSQARERLPSSGDGSMRKAAFCRSVQAVAVSDQRDDRAVTADVMEVMMSTKRDHDAIVENAWAEGYVSALSDASGIVRALLQTAESCKRGGQATSYLRDALRQLDRPGTKSNFVGLDYEDSGSPDSGELDVMTREMRK